MRFVLALSMLATAAYAEDVPLTGYVRGMDGAGMAGVAVSAKAPGSTITTSVYTDKSGLYSFSPMPTGKYRMWAQAIGYQTARADFDLESGKWHNFRLAGNSDSEQ